MLSNESGERRLRQPPACGSKTAAGSNVLSTVLLYLYGSCSILQKYSDPWENLFSYTSSNKSLRRKFSSDSSFRDQLSVDAAHQCLIATCLEERALCQMPSRRSESHPVANQDPFARMTHARRPLDFSNI